MNEPEFKDFPSTAVATIATGVVLGKWEDAHALAEWILGHPVWTHHFPKLREQLAAAIKAQFPDMPIEMDGVDRENWRTYAADIEARFGKTLSVRRGDGDTAMHPMEGFPDGAEVIVVKAP